MTNDFYKDKLAEFKIGNVYFQPTLMNGNPYIQKWEYFNNSIHNGQNLYTINPENHQYYVKSVGVGAFISIALVCLITDFMNFFKLHFKD